MTPRGKFMKVCSVVCPSGATTQDFFTLNLDSWSPDTFTDKSGGASYLVFTCWVDLEIYDHTGGGSHTSRSVYFRFARDAGTPTTSIDLTEGSGGLAVSFSGGVSGSTCKFKVTGTASDPSSDLDFDGVVHYEAHY
jgi:hypothetical protein